MGYRDRNNNYPGSRPVDWSEPERCYKEQKHVHELQGSVKIADEEEPHNHRFCTVTGEAIPYGVDNHVHEVVFRTDYFDGHYHEYCGKTGCAIPVGNRHVHYIEAVTSMDDGHRHAFEAATMIEDPIKKECEKDEHHHRDNNYRR